MKFIRRSDLTLQTRIESALLATVNQGMYGSITHLASVYKISRTFVYYLLWAAHFALVKEFTTSIPSTQPRAVHEQLLDKSILLLRLEGNCSIESISQILMALGLHRRCPN